jgi:histidinol phosphatase-like PHP family hydrolase
LPLPNADTNTWRSGRRHVGAKLSIKSIERQHTEVWRLNEELRGRLSVLHGVELSICPNGELNDLNDILEGVEFVIACIRDGMDQPPPPDHAPTP